MAMPWQKDWYDMIHCTIKSRVIKWSVICKTTPHLYFLVFFVTAYIFRQPLLDVTQKKNW